MIGHSFCLKLSRIQRILLLIGAAIAVLRHSRADFSARVIMEFGIIAIQRGGIVGLGQLFGKLLGGSGKGEAAAVAAQSIEYNGFTITAAPLKEGSQYKTAGSISKELDGEMKTASFIRADNHADRESAISHTERKAQQIIDEQGDAMFERSHI